MARRKRNQGERKVHWEVPKKESRLCGLGEVCCSMKVSGISRTGKESNEVGELNQSRTRQFCKSLRCFRVAHGKTHKLFIVIIITLGMEYLEMGEQLRNTLSLDAAGLLQALMLF